MTPNHDDLTDSLGRALHDRADGVGAPLTLSDVKGRATRIRRRRAIAASAAVAAAVAVIVPTAIAGSDMFDRSDSGRDNVATNPTPGPTDTGGDATSWPQKLDTSDLELGDTPGVTWKQGTTLHTPGGDLELARDYSQVVPYDDDGYMAMSYATGMIYRLDANGEEIGSTDSQSPLASSSDGRYVLYVGSGTLVLHDNETEGDTVIGSGHAQTDPVAVVDGVAYYDVDRNKFPQDGRYWDGQEHDPTPDSRQPWNGVSDSGLSLLHSEITDFGSCTTLNGPAPAFEVLGENCDFTVENFSPDGEHVMGAPAYRDGFGDTELAVLPADGSAIEAGQVVFHYTWQDEQGPTFLDAVWEDDEHLLVITFTQEPGSANGTWQIIRLGLDGSIEDAVEPFEGSNEDYPFALG